MLDFLKYLCQLFVSPGRGWEDISYSGKPYKQLTTEGLYPLLGVAALSVFVGYFYNNEYTLVDLLQQSIITFVKYFVTLYLAGILFTTYVHKMIDGELNDKKNYTFIIYNIALLATYSTIENCLPIQLAFVKFLPLYSAIIIWKGTRYIGVKQDSILEFTILGVAALIVPPYVISWIFNAIIP